MVKELIICIYICICYVLYSCFWPTVHKPHHYGRVIITMITFQHNQSEETFILKVNLWQTSKRRPAGGKVESWTVESCHTRVTSARVWVDVWGCKDVWVSIVKCNLSFSQRPSIAVYLRNLLYWVASVISHSPHLTILSVLRFSLFPRVKAEESVLGEQQGYSLGVVIVLAVEWMANQENLTPRLLVFLQGFLKPMGAK